MTYDVSGIMQLKPAAVNEMDMACGSASEIFAELRGWPLMTASATEALDGTTATTT